MQSATTTNEVRWSDDVIEELLKKLRNDIITKLLDDTLLRSYCEKRFNKKLKTKNAEKVKAALKQYRLKSVDMRHYESIILQIKSTDTATFSEIDQGLFYSDIGRIIDNHRY